MRDVDLPDPSTTLHRWSVVAGVLAARFGHDRSAHATASTAWYDDGGGNWVRVVLLDGGRAVLVGHDHEYTETYFREAAAYFGEPETDLLAEVPGWWASGFEIQRSTDMEWIGFVYGYEPELGWRRADYDVPDGFASIKVAWRSAAACVEAITELVPRGTPAEAVGSAAAAGPALTTDQLRALGFDPDRARLGSRVAAAFAGLGAHHRPPGSK